MAFTTRISLLVRVKAGNEIAWHEFRDKYKILILLCGQDRGLTPAENDELVQDVMWEIFRKNIIGNYDPDHIPDDITFHYDPSHGRFRHFLRGIIHHHASKILKKRNRHVELDDPKQQIPEPQEDVWEKLWDEEWKQQILDEALTELKGHVKPKTYQAFDLCAIQGRPVKEVASLLDISIESVYQAKSRCVDKLKDIISKLEE